MCLLLENSLLERNTLFSLPMAASLLAAPTPHHTATPLPQRPAYLVVNLRDQVLFVADRVGGCCGRKVNVSKCVCSKCLIFFV